MVSILGREKPLACSGVCQMAKNRLVLNSLHPWHAHHPPWITQTLFHALQRPLIAAFVRRSRVQIIIIAFDWPFLPSSLACEYWRVKNWRRQEEEEEEDKKNSTTTRRFFQFADYFQMIRKRRSWVCSRTLCVLWKRYFARIWSTETKLLLGQVEKKLMGNWKGEENSVTIFIKGVNRRYDDRAFLVR